MSALTTFNGLAILRNLFLIERPRRTLEVGLAFGGSALVFTSGHKELHMTPGRQHVAIDPFQSTVWDDAGLLAVDRAGLGDFFDFRPQFSSAALPDLLASGWAGSIGLAYVDGSHLFEDVFVDWYFLARLLAPNGVVVFDDATDRHVGKVLRFIRRNFEASFAPVDLASFRADGGRGWRARAAGLLGRTQFVAFRKVGRDTRAWDSPFSDF